MVGVFDQVTVNPALQRIGRSSYTVAFDMVRGSDDVVVSQGTMTFVCRDADGAALPVPDLLLDVLQALPAGRES